MKRGRLKQTTDPVVSEKRLKLANKQSKQESKTKAESKAKVIKVKKEDEEETTVSIGARELFIHSIEKFYYEKYEIYKRGKSLYRDTHERVDAIKRIEHAIQSRVNQIVTLEFFNFIDVLGPGTSEHVDADVEVVVFDSKDVLMSRAPIFRGKISTASSVKSGINVVYFPISFEVEKFAESVYVICTIRNVPVNDTRDRKRGMRSSRSSSKENLEFKTFYGVRKIMIRRVHELEIKQLNASIILDHMDGPSNIGAIMRNNNWRVNNGLLNKFCHVITQANIISSLPSVTFEVSDQHVEEDWDDIMNDLDFRFKDFARRPSEDYLIKFVEDVLGSPEKENGDPIEIFEHPSRFLLGMRDYVCPITAKTFANLEALVLHMNGMSNRLGYRIVSPTIIAVFQCVKTAQIVLDATSAESATATSVDKKVVPVKPTKWEPGIIPYLSMPFANIIKEPIQLYPDEQFVLHRSSSNWYAENTHRRIWEFIDATDKEKKFMERFDVFFSQESRYPPVSKSMKRLQIGLFVEKNRKFLLEENLISLMTTFLNQCFTADIISADDMYEMLLSLSV